MMRTPFKAIGGKTYMAKRLQGQMPLKWASMVENFARSYALTLSLPYSGRYEVWNDLDKDLFELMSAIKNPNHCKDLIFFLKKLPYEQRIFEAARTIPDSSRTVLDTFVILNMSRGGMGKDFSWSDRIRGGQPGDVNAWLTKIDALPEISKRLEHVTLRHGCGIELADALHLDETVFQYWDPPYIHNSRISKKVYGDFEMSVEDHERLAVIANDSKGPILISGYNCPEYEKWYRKPKWIRVDFPMANHSGQTKTKSQRIESIWRNY